MSEAARPPSTVRVVWRLLVAARRRATSRVQRQREIARQRTGGRFNWGVLGVVFGVAFALAVHGMAGHLVREAVTAGQRLSAEAAGQVVVEDWFVEQLAIAQDEADGVPTPWRQIERALAPDVAREADAFARDHGGDARQLEARLRAAIHARRLDAIVGISDAAPGLGATIPLAGIAGLFGSAALVLWLLMLVAQGEGVDLDMNRRRHPMWEWVLSHPVQPAALFVAEMLSPIAANALFWTAPVFPAVVYGSVYGGARGVLAGLLVGVPATLAAACLGKAIEIAALLRLPPRSRGAMLGIVGWIGTTAATAILFAALPLDQVATALAGPARAMARLPWPMLGWLLGQDVQGEFSLVRGVLACWLLSAGVIALAVGWSAWSAREGLAGPPAQIVAPSRTMLTRGRLDPLFRKELLWFRRDRSAVVQALLIPLTMASVQLFQLRGLLEDARGAWNVLCGGAVIFGTYFIAVLGPKSLASEGSALWIALTWPRGLESLLRAKARLWALIASAIVGVVLCYAVCLFPADWWRIALVAAGWAVFARSVADKAVTLATVTAPSGETQAVPAGRRWAVYLGTFAFAIGIISRQWPVAVAGVFYSVMTAAAMWQNFRARLPLLYDPWSERLPPPPTLMHAMIAITLLIEGGAVFGGAVQALAGRDTVAVAIAIAYVVSALCVSSGVAIYLARRGVSFAGTWRWGARAGWPPLMAGLAAGVAVGLALGLVGREYGAMLRQAGWIDDGGEGVPNLRAAYTVMAVLIAPFAEEYLFRGLLFRALDREWGSGRAVAGSAVFFALYHPFTSWLPVGGLGALNAVLFKRTGHLAPAVVAHMVYNAVILT